MTMICSLSHSETLILQEFIKWKEQLVQTDACNIGKWLKYVRTRLSPNMQLHAVQYCDMTPESCNLPI
jgi:hypothetical protein